MNETLENFKSESINRGLCKSFTDRWQKMQTQDDFITFSLDPKSISYIALSTYEGWGLTTSYILEHFSNYINGREVPNSDSSLFCMATGGYPILKLENNIMQSNISLDIPKTKCPILHINNGSDVTVNAQGFNTIKIYMYDTSKVKINIDNSCRVFVMNLSKDAVIECNMPNRMTERFGNVRHYAYGDEDYIDN